MAKPVKLIIGGVVVVVGVSLYALGNYYAQKEANSQAKALISKIQTQFPEVKDVTYQSIDVGLFSFVTHRFNINQVNMTVFDQPIKLDHIGVSDFVLSSDNKLSQVDVTFNHIQLDLEKNGPAKTYLNILQARKAQLDELASKTDPNHVSDPDIKHYQAWFDLLDALANQYAQSYGNYTFKYNQAKETLSTDLSIWRSTDQSKPLMEVKSDLNKINLKDTSFDELLKQAVLGAQMVEVNLDHALQTDSKVANDALKNYLYGIDPSFNFKFDYQPENQTVNVTLATNNNYQLNGKKSTQHYNANLSLADVTINQYSVDSLINGNSPYAGFEKAYIKASNANVDAQFDFPKSFIESQAQNIGLKAIISMLPYKEYNFYIKGKTAYDDGNGDDTANVSFGFLNKLDMNLNAKVHVTDKLMVSDYIKMFSESLAESQKDAIEEQNNQNMEESVLNELLKSFQQSSVVNDKMKLVSWDFTLANHNDFLQNMTKMASSILQMSEANIKELEKSFINGMLDSNNTLLPMKNYQTALEKFIDNPEELTLSINPNPPVTMTAFYQTVINYLIYHQQKVHDQEVQQQAMGNTDVPMVVRPALSVNKVDEKSLKASLDQLDIKLEAK